MPEKEPKVILTSNPLSKPSKRSSIASKSIRRWFVNNQKTEAWDQKALNTLHIQIVVLLVLVYACHLIRSPFIRFIKDLAYLVIGSPFIRLIEHHIALIIIYIMYTIILTVAAVYAFEQRASSLALRHPQRRQYRQYDGKANERGSRETDQQYGILAGDDYPS